MVFIINVVIVGCGRVCSKAGIVELYSGHTAPVTALHYHPASHEDEFESSDLLLSSSFDWSVMLWSPKGHGAPLHTFHASDDYAMDVEWYDKTSKRDTQTLLKLSFQASASPSNLCFFIC